MTLSAAQLEARKNALGGSDMGSVMGLSEWKSPIELWKEKRGEGEQFHPNEAMEMGHVLEPIIADLFAQKNIDMQVIEPDEETYIHEKLPFLIAHPDRLLRDSQGRLGILEIKTSRYGWDRCPAQYEIQQRHYMNVIGAEFSILAALFGGSQYHQEALLERNLLVDAVMEKHATKFMDSMVTGECPFDPSTLDDVQLIFPTADKKLTLNLAEDDPLVEKVRRYTILKQKMDDLESQLGEVKAGIGSALGSAYNAKLGGKVIASFPTVKGRKTLDQFALIKAHPEIDLNKYQKTGNPYRRLTVKAIPNG